MPDFATRLRELRLARALRQKDLAVALGLAQTTIANYEQKLRFPDEPTLVKIADYFGVSLDSLMGRSNGAAGPRPGAEDAAGQPEAGPGGTAGRAPLAALAREYLALLREKGAAAARARLADAMAGGLSIREIYLDVMAPALREAGRLWAVGEMSVAQEHEASEATQRIMAALLPGAPAPRRPGLCCVVLPVSGEQHLIGSRMVADLLSLEGIPARFAGSGLSIRHMREMLLAAPPDLVAFSATMPENLNAAADVIAVLRGRRELSATRIMVGGQAFLGQADLWARIGADATAADAAEAVRAALRLVAAPD